MQVFINERKVKINREIGRWASLGGLGVLIVGMIVSLARPELVWITMLSLLVGFLGSTVGSYFASRWTRSPRADEVLSQALKGVSSQYHLYHYLLPVPHVLLGPSGLYVIRAYLHEGMVTYDGKKWKQKFNIMRALGFSGQDSLVDPVRDALYDAQRLEKLMSKSLPPDKMPEIRPLIVFVRDKVELQIAETPVPVVRYKQLKGIVRRLDKECRDPLGEDVLYEIERALLGSKIDEL